MAGAGQRVLTRDSRAFPKSKVVRDEALGAPALMFQVLKCYCSSS